MFFGLLSMAAGVAWICLLFFFEPLKITLQGQTQSTSILQMIPTWVAVLLGAKIFCGFWVSSRTHTDMTIVYGHGL